ncbi:uncharacterized protein LOC127445517 [Myxocyprinus asiaticus]|uniref:uncharacterized protein LOC127445517 n=1 Tax=Myxocyprinus asiaticus TaxID=70543 RepID=UPI002223AE97|nr:uncharacterized protein LOC127445517 [Myxocyprinus asiaticus]XP_051561624.1 uncharacterized protein LOC127445517 [Myxocyprinus asiaticus]
MVQLKTLNELAQLRDSRFGQPYPRHGLNLLWWFAKKCVYIDKKGCMIAQCNPENGDFGFHRFHNTDGLLPSSSLPYYEVGNLNTPGRLPHYVKRNYYHCYSDDSNTDRIIVSLISSRNGEVKYFDKIYVTRHSDQVHFEHNRTYLISRGLIKIIENFESRGEFLSKTVDNQRYDPEAVLQPESFRNKKNSTESRPFQSQNLQQSSNHTTLKTIGGCCGLFCWSALLIVLFLIYHFRI